MGETIKFDGGLNDGEENVYGSFAFRIYILLFDVESERWRRFMVFKFIEMVRYRLVCLEEFLCLNR